jgi:hypothetical protein
MTRTSYVIWDYVLFFVLDLHAYLDYFYSVNALNKGNNKITELRTILQRESQNS